MKPGNWKKIRKCSKCGTYIRSQSKSLLCHKHSAIKNLDKSRKEHKNTILQIT